MKKDALLGNDPFSRRSDAVVSSTSAGLGGAAFFRQNRVSVLTKIQCTMPLMPLTSDNCERPAL
ncbi:hypothetical protein [Ochrobactrum sp. Marseille-Q0166]|uniref:hypothetical protein n=1 Tax=Ochrobactrum sp. Marseille-Q0166 TaxID=2761105 RepID=UPI0016558899|nr:hypothetical protein [Ochrobactrum sp. Marseille-Q0166]MBC8717583.1 hypothetical protein [Ochrobactrum sp. Marseille-Q0166]